MKKVGSICNLCGRPKNKVIEDLVKGNICNSCAIENSSYTVYNREISDAITNHRDSRAIIKVLKDVQKRYVVKLVTYKILGDSIQMLYATRYRGKLRRLRVWTDTLRDGRTGCSYMIYDEDANDPIVCRGFFN